MGRSNCPHCGEKILIRHYVSKSEFDEERRGTNPNSHPRRFDRIEMYRFYLDGIPKTALMAKYGVSKRAIDAAIKEMRELKNLPHNGALNNGKG